MYTKRINKLIERYLFDKATVEEQIELLSWYDHENNKDIIWPCDSVHEEELLGQRIFAKIAAHTQKEDSTKSADTFIKLWPSIIAVAAILFLLGAGMIFFSYRINKAPYPERSTEVIVPGKNGATLTLASGKKIYLSNTTAGIVTKEAGVKITKSADGQLIYEVSNSPRTTNSTGELHYNTLTTSRGEQYQVLLPDSSLVWLNAASALKYPTSFASLKERRIELSGEAYFQVAKDKKHPFIVYSRGQEVKALGTHFNINGYENEYSVQTTLLEGAIEVTAKSEKDNFNQDRSAANKIVVMKPGQQSQIREGRIYILNNVDLDDVVAWKQGYFIFNENLRNIMNKVARWYNIEVVYKNEPDPKLAFQGKIARSRKLSDILGIMERTGAVNFSVEGRRVIITIN